jgi:Stabilization of polarity axis
MDLSLMPKLSYFERQILQSSDNKELFIEKFQQMIDQRTAEEMEEKIATQKAQGDQDDERGEGNGRLNDGHDSSVTRSPYSYDHRRMLPRDTHEFESRVFYNSIPIPIKVPVAISPETVGDFSLIKLIQTFSAPHARDPQPFMLHPHLTTGGAYTHPIIVLINAMLTQKRVMFVGHKLPSGEVVEAVLAACALASGGILRGFTRHAFPYTDLTKIDDLLKVPGFIAGVTNPAFANHPEWWDLLCDIPTGRMKISGSVEPAPVTEGLLYFQQQNPTHANPSNPIFPAPGTDPTGDQAFMEDVLRSIASRHGEGVIRAKWRDWIAKFTRIAAAFEESVYGASALYVGGEEAEVASGAAAGHGYVWVDESARQKELAGNVSRIEGWRNTRSYYSFIQVSRRDLHPLLLEMRCFLPNRNESTIDAILMMFSAGPRPRLLN